MSSNASQRSSIADKLERVQLNHTHGVPLQPGRRTRDITNDYHYASKGLAIGQLVKDETFSLFDSVQALEIMDPKMDTGCLEPGESLEDEFDISRNLTTEEIIWIMDEMICYQTAWHEGYALAQNIFTSVYIYNLLSQKRPKASPPLFKNLEGDRSEPSQLTQIVLRAFCISVIKSCDIAIELVQSQQYYEEEDFSTYTFDKDLLTDITDEEYLGLVQTAQDWITSQLERGLISEEICTALVARLTLNCRLLSIVLPLGDKLTPNYLWVEGFDQMLLALEKTHAIGRPVKGSFNQKLQRKLASNIPPRPINEMPFSKACIAVRKLHEDLLEAASADSFEKGISLHRLEAYLLSFTSRNPLCLPRAVVQMFLFGDGRVVAPGEDGIQTSIWQELQDYTPAENRLSRSIFTVEAPNDDRFLCANVFLEWSRQAQDTYIKVLRSLCQNSCRIRRCLANTVHDINNLLIKLIEKFFNSNSEYERILREQKLKQDYPALSSTHMKLEVCHLVEKFRLRIIDLVLALGFEQDIYLQNELPGIYALDYEVVVNSDRSVNKHGDALKELDLNSIPQARSLDIQTRANMLQSITNFYGILVSLDAISFPPHPYCSPIAQSELRLNSFISSQPESCVFRVPNLSMNNMVPSGNCQTLLRAASESLSSAKSTIMPLITRPSEFVAWLESAELATTHAAAEFLRERLKEAARTCFALGKLLDVLSKALTDHGSEAALKGKVSIVMSEVQRGRWVLPIELRIEK